MTSTLATPRGWKQGLSPQISLTEKDALTRAYTSNFSHKERCIKANHKRSLMLSLPLSQGFILHNSKLVSKVHKLHFGERLGENINRLLISTNVSQLDSFPQYHISNIVVFDLNMFSSVMKHWIDRKLHTTLIITMNDSRLHRLSKQSCKELPKPHNFTSCHTSCNILGLCCA